MRRHNFRRLKIWEKGLDIVEVVYDFADTLPENEKYGLCSQLTRAAVSIPSNIAEGSSKSSAKDFARFIEMALGSAFEVETQLLICERREIGNHELRLNAQSLLPEIQKMIGSFYDRLKTPSE